MSNKGIVIVFVILLAFMCLLTRPPTPENQQIHELMQTIPAVIGAAALAIICLGSKSKLGKLIGVVAIIAGLACFLW